MAMAIKKSLLALAFVAFFAGCSQSEQPARKECAMFEGFETNMTFGLNMADPFDVLLENGVGFDDATACRYGRTMLKMDVEETTLRSAYGFLPTQILIGETEHEIRQVEFVKQLGKVQSDMAHKAYDELCRRVDCSLTRSFDPGSIGGSEDAYHQVFEIDADGTASVQKFGYRLERGRWNFTGTIIHIEE